MYNLFVAYDLVPPGQNYDAVIERITSLGQYAKLQQSFFYVQSNVDMQTAHNFIREVMDPNDKLAVIWAADAHISNYPMGNLQILSQVFTSTTQRQIA